jgi:hypothetical protein
MHLRMNLRKADKKGRLESVDPTSLELFSKLVLQLHRARAKLTVCRDGNWEDARCTRSQTRDQLPFNNWRLKESIFVKLLSVRIQHCC